MDTTNCDEIYEQLNQLKVEIRFDTDLGFPYLSTKLQETQQVIEALTTLQVKITGALARHLGNAAKARKDFKATHLPAHREEQRSAEAEVASLRCLLHAVKARYHVAEQRNLDIRTYARLLENEMKYICPRPSDRS